MNFCRKTGRRPNKELVKEPILFASRMRASLVTLILLLGAESSLEALPMMSNSSSDDTTYAPKSLDDNLLSSHASKERFRGIGGITSFEEIFGFDLPEAQNQDANTRLLEVLTDPRWQGEDPLIEVQLGHVVTQRLRERASQRGTSIPTNRNQSVQIEPVALASENLPAIELRIGITEQFMNMRVDSPFSNFMASAAVSGADLAFQVSESTREFTGITDDWTSFDTSGGQFRNNYRPLAGIQLDQDNPAKAGNNSKRERTVIYLPNLIAKIVDYLMSSPLTYIALFAIISLFVFTRLVRR